MSLVLESKVGGDFKPHLEGIHPAVCVDVIDLGLVETEFQGQRRLVNKVRLVFETEQRNEDGQELHASARPSRRACIRRRSWRSSWASGAGGRWCRARASTWRS